MSVEEETIDAVRSNYLELIQEDMYKPSKEIYAIVFNNNSTTVILIQLYYFGISGSTDEREFAKDLGRFIKLTREETVAAHYNNRQ